MRQTINIIRLYEEIKHMNCKHCNADMKERKFVCPECGKVQLDESVLTDRGGFLYGFLSFLIPAAGVFIWLVFKDTKPKTSSAAFIGLIIFLAFYTFGGVQFYIVWRQHPELYLFAD